MRGGGSSQGFSVANWERDKRKEFRDKQKEKDLKYMKELKKWEADLEKWEADFPEQARLRRLRMKNTHDEIKQRREELPEKSRAPVSKEVDHAIALNAEAAFQADQMMHRLQGVTDDEMEEGLDKLLQGEDAEEAEDAEDAEARVAVEATPAPEDPEEEEEEETLGPPPGVVAAGRAEKKGTWATVEPPQRLATTTR